jgi:hypothetical protein
MAEFPLWAALTIIAASVLLMIFCVACCAARCFRPENEKGTAWYPNKEGKETYARGFFEQDDKKEGFVRVRDSAGAGGAAGAGAGAAGVGAGATASS